MRLKSSKMHRFSIPDIKFFIGNVYDSTFNIYSKSASLKDFVGAYTSNIPGSTEVWDQPISKN